jgi:predicted enzyme related to lactoylglutathione lyase
LKEVKESPILGRNVELRNEGPQEAQKEKHKKHIVFVLFAFLFSFFGSSPHCEDNMEPKVGSFCWLELGTTDRNAAKKFYSGLFGWTAEDLPMGPDMAYTMFRLAGKDVAGGYQLMKEQLDAKVPPHWMLYVKVQSADAATAKAVQLGAQQLVPPSDIPNVGRFALIQDPTGANISVFQPGQHRGITVFGEVGALCWADLNSQNPERAARFYGDWLGWTHETGKDGYRHILNGGKEDMIGGIPPRMHAPPGTPSHWLSYIHVADCKATASKAAQLGASTMLPAELMPDVGTIAVLADPQGAAFALYQPLSRG